MDEPLTVRGVAGGCQVPDVRVGRHIPSDQRRSVRVGKGVRAHERTFTSTWPSRQS